MRDVLDKLMCARWPDLYRGRGKPMNESSMFWGFTHDDGWFSIIDSASSTITRGAEDAGQPVPEAAQVKEKLGGLRFYLSMDDGNEFAYGATWFAEAMSERTCERTGQPGRLYSTGGYLQTLSPPLATPKSRPLGEDDDRISLFLRAGHDGLLHALRARHPGLPASCAIDIPAGWADIADVLLRCLNGQMRPRDHDVSQRAAIASVDMADAALRVDVSGCTQQELGAVSCAMALARLTDPQTGASGPVNDQGERVHSGVQPVPEVPAAS